LRRLFDAAETTGVVLFLDEADALFGSQGEGHNRNDRYANEEMGNLLERVERFSGAAVFGARTSDSLRPGFFGAPGTS
jgi:SpoVK/Ycf46/Vps4 family AAA+-type ATPase